MNIKNWKTSALCSLAESKPDYLKTESVVIDSVKDSKNNSQSGSINKYSTTIHATNQTEIEILLCWVLNKNKAYLRAFDNTELSAEQIIKLDGCLSQLVNGKPVAYITGEKDFWDMTLKVNEYTLIPRADTETLLELLQTIYTESSSFSVVDLGTGSGAIAIAITRIFPNAKVSAIDNSKDALQMAKINAKSWAKTNINFIENNWLENIIEQFDCIVANPPYIAKNDNHLLNLKFEPITALVANDNGLSDIKNIIRQSQNCLKNNGHLIIEHGFEQGSAVRSFFEIQLDITGNKVWKNPKTIKDLSHNDRLTYVKKC